MNISKYLLDDSEDDELPIIIKNNIIYNVIENIEDDKEDSEEDFEEDYEEEENEYEIDDFEYIDENEDSDDEVSINN